MLFYACFILLPEVYELEQTKQGVILIQALLASLFSVNITP